MTNDAITFSFGENWKSFLENVDEDSLRLAQKDIEEWVGEYGIEGRTVVDIGSGSGLHSLCFYLLQAKQIFSFDADGKSVEATRSLWEKAGRPENWSVTGGSILDSEFLRDLGTFDIVYSWGVLHHTGDLWRAVDSAASLVKTSGLFWIAIYVRGARYQQDLALKQKYNRSSSLGKRILIGKQILRIMRKRIAWGQNPFTWNEKRGRGMNTYHDLIDWLGGLPYEVASKEEMLQHCRDKGFELLKMKEAAEGSNNVYLFRKIANG